MVLGRAWVGQSGAAAMSRRFLIAKGKVGPLFDSVEARARAKFLDVRAIKGSDYVVPDHVFYGPRRGPVVPPLTSAELRAAADEALVAEIEASIERLKKP